ncbi:MAG: DNA helicase RecQ [Pseudomonadota bacterium]
MSLAQPIREDQNERPDPLGVLRDTFGYDSFRPGQNEVVQTLLSGSSVLAVMPTGAGKSLCFQVPALVMGGLTIVVSPLVALMDDQVAALKANGVAAEAIHGSKHREDNVAIWHAVTRGDVRLLYMAPERLMTQRMLDALSRQPLSLIAVDEAHCMSRWGASFRPEYAALETLSAHFPTVPIAAMTATADEATRRDIQTSLFGGPYRTFVSGFDRPNIHLAASRKANAKDQLLNFVADRKGQSGIVYCLSRKKTEETAALLRENGITSLPYHAGLDAETRADHQNRFLTEDGLVICATIAFGMGIDKADVRFVFHTDMPGSMEAYYQEIGRAGRDGQPAEAHMLFGPGDMRLRRQFVESEFEDPERQHQEMRRLEALIGYADATGCRRQTLLRYFGEASEPCGRCDRCEAPDDLTDASEDACMVIGAVRDTGQRYGQAHLVDVLTGERTEKVTKARHDQLSFFGAGTSRSKTAWRDFIRQMISAGFLEVDVGGYASVLISAKGEDLAGGKGAFQFRDDKLADRASKGGAGSNSLRSHGFAVSDAADEPLSENDQKLLARLKAKRLEMAKERSVPAYVIFADRTLTDMARERPTCIDDFRTIKGVGAKKLNSFAADFLDVIQQN